MQADVLAVVVTYNRCAMLMQCMTKLQEQSIPCDVLVIDNASTDQTQTLVPPITNEHLFYQRQLTNTGGAGGFHAGMRKGVEMGYSYIWIMDDDAYPAPDALEELLNAAGHVGDFGFLCSTILWTDGKECRMNRQGIDKQKFYEHVEWLQHGILPVTQSTFVSCFFKAETIRKAGLPIKAFFIWGDDIEYTRRLAVRMQLPCYLVGKSIVVHHMASNVGSDISTDSPERLNRYVYAYRNENYLYRQEGIKGVLYYLARCGLHLARLWTRAKDHRLKRSWVLISSFFRGWGFHPQIEYITEENEL